MMRTDLAIEAHELNDKVIDGIDFSETKKGNLTIKRINIKSLKAAESLNKPIGNYITIESMPLTDNFRDVKEQIIVIADEIHTLLPENGTVLVVGIGNIEITPDALGPKSAELILATRHITGEIARSAGLDNLRPVAVISPGVLGQTGIEVSELLSSLVKNLSPSVIIAIDALASKNLERLGRTIQISDSGISPGAGVGNNRIKLNHENLGVPVIGIGIPTVVDAATLAIDLLGNNEKSEKELKKKVSPRGEQMMVTPREIDLLTERASKLIGMAVNCAVQTDYDFDDIAALIS